MSINVLLSDHYLITFKLKGFGTATFTFLCMIFKVVMVILKTRCSHIKKGFNYLYKYWLKGTQPF